VLRFGTRSVSIGVYRDGGVQATAPTIPPPEIPTRPEKVLPSSKTGMARSQSRPLPPPD